MKCVTCKVDLDQHGTRDFETCLQKASVPRSVISVQARKARVRSLQEPWLDNPVWELLVSCMAFGAKLERDRLIERTKAGMERAKREGKQIGRPCGSTPSRSTLWRRTRKT